MTEAATSELSSAALEDAFEAYLATQRKQSTAKTRRSELRRAIDALESSKPVTDLTPDDVRAAQAVTRPSAQRSLATFLRRAGRADLASLLIDPKRTVRERLTVTSQLNVGPPFTELREIRAAVQLRAGYGGSGRGWYGVVRPDPGCECRTCALGRTLLFVFLGNTRVEVERNIEQRMGEHTASGRAMNPRRALIPGIEQSSSVWTAQRAWRAGSGWHLAPRGRIFLYCRCAMCQAGAANAQSSPTQWIYAGTNEFDFQVVVDGLLTLHAAGPPTDGLPPSWADVTREQVALLLGATPPHVASGRDSHKALAATASRHNWTVQLSRGPGGYRGQPPDGCDCWTCKQPSLGLGEAADAARFIERWATEHDQGHPRGPSDVAWDFAELTTIGQQTVSVSEHLVAFQIIREPEAFPPASIPWPSVPPSAVLGSRLVTPT